MKNFELKKSQKIYLPFKRLIDILGSIVGIVLCSSFVWWWTFLINLFVTKGHPFFIQYRYGKNKKVFGLIKFRSMYVNSNPNISPSKMSVDEQRSMETKFGRFLRKSSIDETLQLFNIFIGQMAFIGPRPGSAKNEEELVQARESYNPSAFVVKPGLSGYAQVKMKRAHNPQEKAKYDSEYVKRMSLWFDAKIFVYTIFMRVFKLKGR